MLLDRSNHPKSRKAIVTIYSTTMYYASFRSSNHPKSRKAIVTPNSSSVNVTLTVVPITPKAERRLWLYLVVHIDKHVNLFQSPQKPKGDCDLPWHTHFAMPFSGSNHPKSRKAIVTISTEARFRRLSPVPITPKAERRLWPALLRLICAGPVQFQSPQKPKGDCDLASSIVAMTSNLMCSNHPKSRKAIVTRQISAQKTGSQL